MPRTWPKTLPQEFEHRGFRETLGDQLVRSTIENKADQRLRRPWRQYNEGRTIVGVFRITRIELLVLEYFYVYELFDGLRSFTMPSPGGTVRVEFGKAPVMTSLGADFYEARVELNVL